MEWLIILVVLLVAFGPILWLRPSARERRLALLRQQAYREGMRVELRRLPRLDAPAEERVTAGGRALDTTREHAVYLYPLATTLRMLPSWRVLRSGDGLQALEGWWFLAGEKPSNPRLEEALEAVAPVLHTLPDDVIAVECEARAVGAYFLEGRETSPSRVSDLAARLSEAARALDTLEARLKAEAEGRNI